MAKPGTNDAARLAAMSRQAADLGKIARLSEEQEAELRMDAEVEYGYRCQGCKRRITLGMELVKIDVAIVDGKKVANRAVTVACLYDDCDFAEKAMTAGAQIARPIEYAWPQDAAQEAVESNGGAPTEDVAPAAAEG